MPHMNGYEATAALKQQGCKTPIVALTANAMKGDEQKCFDAGCDGFLAKPIDRRELPRILAKYLARQDSTSRTIDSVPTQVFEPGPFCSEQGSSQPQSGESDNIEDIGTTIYWDLLIDKLGDEETVREIMPIYIKDTQEHFEKLSEAVQIRECESIASHAHALKSVGMNLSIERLFDLSREMEYAARENDTKAAILLFDDLKTEVDNVVAALSQCDWIERVKTA